jgi:miniconductance mechanosensitive channel
MNNLINDWLLSYFPHNQHIELLHQLVGSSALLLIGFLGFYLAKHQLLTFINHIVESSENQWDDFLLKHRVFARFALILPYIVLFVFSPWFLIEDSRLLHIVMVIAKVGIALQTARSISAFLNVINSVYFHRANEQFFPINATVQVIKLIVYLVAIILAISFVIDKSPVYLLSGLGAITAVLLLVFQDTIKGLVASIQISAYRMVAIGDWIEMPQYGADGDVLEIGLNTVKVQNWDKTITTIPTYALTTESFRNWRGMYNAGGRRIKRALMIDLSSIHFCSEEELAVFENIRLLAPYLAEKKQAIKQTNAQLAVPDNDKFNARRLTNIGTFRAYVAAYLKQHPLIHKEMTCMVRQLPSTPTGLPLEIYCFSQDLVWQNYENLQSDIFDHLFAMVPHFNLRCFQHPTGADFQQLTQISKLN